MPLNEASCAVLLIWEMMPLYWLTKLARIAWEAEFTVGATAAATPVKASAVPPTAPSVNEAASLVVLKTSLPALFRLAVTLLAANAAFNWSIVSDAPKVMLVAVPPAVAAIVSVLPDAMLVPSTRFAALPTVVAEVAVDLTEYPTGACNTCWAIDLAVSTSFCSEVRPVLAACSTWTPLPMLSSRLVISLARLLRPCAVKKFVGLSRAELTLLPVARRFCGGGEQFRGRLKREQVLTNRCRENNCRHFESFLVSSSLS